LAELVGESSVTIPGASGLGLAENSACMWGSMWLANLGGKNRLNMMLVLAPASFDNLFFGRLDAGQPFCCVGWVPAGRFRDTWMLSPASDCFTTLLLNPAIHEMSWLYHHFCCIEASFW